ncbi:MAG: S9 family peptidase [Pyrinomonas sp.]|uniref:S9 family peptidase n=1 Tax=Pyrinomonas sp. TaxID=2080306 RepID=UPI0033286296
MTMSLQAQQNLPPLIPREVLFGNPERASPQISPDGRLLAYLAPHNGVLNVWVRTIGQRDDRVVTDDRKRGIRIYFWQPDSRHIIYLQDQNGDENWRVYQTSIETKQTRDLTPFERVQARIVAVYPDIPDRILVALNNRDPRLHDVYRVDLKTGKLELDTQNPGDVADWVADNELRVRAAEVLLPDGSAEIRIRDNERSPWRVFLKWGPDESFGGIAGFTQDNRRVWLISSVEANAARLLEVDLATGKQRVIAADPQYDVGGILVHPRKRTLEAVSFVRARTEWQIIDRSLEPDFAALRKVRDGDISISSRDLDDRTWIVSYVVDDGPVYWYTYDRRSRRAQLLFSNNSKLEKYKLAKMQPISFRARDGMTIYGYLTLPVGVEPRDLPMVLLVHGGPWARDTWGYNPMVQWLANRGYAVLQINFRGSTGYGKAYLNAGDREWAGKMHDDLIDGKNWAVKQGIADPKRVAIMGGSYGGYATLVGLAFTPDDFAAGVDIVGPSNLVTLLQSIPPYWAPIKATFNKRMGSDEEFLKSRSPLFRANQIKKPLLIGQGANDPRVKQAESDQIVEALRKANIPVEYIVYTDEGHGFARPENRLHFYAKAEEFLAKHLGGRFEPMGEIRGHSGVIK